MPDTEETVQSTSGLRLSKSKTPGDVLHSWSPGNGY